VEEKPESKLLDPESQRFRNLVAALPDIIYVLDSGGHFVYINDAIKSLGYDPTELRGKHFTKIILEEDREDVSRDVVLTRIRSMDHFPDSPPKLFDERRSGPRMTKNLQVRLIRKDKDEVFYGSVNAYGETDPDPSISDHGMSSGFVTMGIIHDITMEILYRRGLEENLAARELMLREIHHRVKNNLQLVASLAHLSEMEMGENADTSAFEELITRVKTMAMVHEALYLTENLEGVRADEYFNKLGRFLEETYGMLGVEVSLVVRADHSLIQVDALANVAMMAHELVSNAYKHAFPTGRTGTITLAFKDYGDKCELKVSDNGIGNPEMRGQGKNTRNDAGSGPFGLEIVFAIARQLDAVVAVDTGEGTTVAILFEKTRTSASKTT
jgi:PAS domain S-box-containing protein